MATFRPVQFDDLSRPRVWPNFIIQYVFNQESLSFKMDTKNPKSGDGPELVMTPTLINLNY